MGANELVHAGLNSTLGFTTAYASTTCVRLDMPVTDAARQVFGCVHGGATISLLESAASWAAALGADPSCELSFGTHVDVRHINSAQQGTLHGTATLAREEDLGERGRKQVWAVEAVDDDGMVISRGEITTRVVTREYRDKRRGQ